MARRPSQEEQPQEPEVEIIQSPTPELEVAIAEVGPAEVAPVVIPELKPVEATTSEDQEEVKPIFATSFYKRLGIPTCSSCGESYRTDTYGQPMCPVGKQSTECPRLSK